MALSVKIRLVLALLVIAYATAKSVDKEEPKSEKKKTEPEPAEYEVVTYSGFKVLDVTPTDSKQVHVLKELENKSEVPGFEFWKEPHNVNESCTISVHPDLVDVMQTYLDMKKIKHKVVVEDLQEVIDSEMKEILKDEEEDGLNYRDPTLSYYSHEKYNRLEQITKRVRELDGAHPGMMTISAIGKTYEGKSIEMVKVSLNDGSDRAGIFIDCGIHAREWISPSFCMYSIDQLLQKGKTGMLGHFDFYFVPVANPDGYEYTWTTNRMWRKNKRPQGAPGAGGSYPKPAPQPAPQPPPQQVYPTPPQFNPPSQFNPGGGGGSGLPIVEDIPKTREQKAKKEEIATKQFWGGVFPGIQFGGQGNPNYPQLPAYPSGVGGGITGGTGGIGGGPGLGQGGFGGGQGGGAAGGKSCMGVDPNRNFDIAWGSVGSSGKSCQDTYHGSSPFSEEESKALANAMRGIVGSGKRLAAYLSVHAYSQFWMSPYGYTKRQAKDYDDHMKVMKAAITALGAEYGTQYKYGPIQKVIYQAGGSSVDWAYEKLNVKYSFALELRDTGRYAFLLPVDQIMPTNKETWAGLNAMAFFIAKEYPVKA